MRMKKLLAVALVVVAFASTNTISYAQEGYLKSDEATLLKIKEKAEKEGKGLSKTSILSQQKAFEEYTNFEEVFSMDANDPEFPEAFGSYVKKYNEYCDKIGQSTNKVKELSNNPTLEEIEAANYNIGSGGDSTYTGDGNSFSVSAITTGEFVLPDLYGICPQGLINHAAIYDKSKYYSNASACFLSANNDNNESGKGYTYIGVNYESPNYYRDAFDQVYVGLVTGVSDANEVKAYEKVKGVASVGEQYSLTTIKSTTSEWYCSKVVWYGYNYALNIDIDFDGGIWVFPVDIYNSGKVTLWKLYE